MLDRLTTFIKITEPWTINPVAIFDWSLDRSAIGDEDTLKGRTRKPIGFLELRTRQRLFEV